MMNWLQYILCCVVSLKEQQIWTFYSLFLSQLFYLSCIVYSLSLTHTLVAVVIRHPVFPSWSSEASFSFAHSDGEAARGSWQRRPNRLISFCFHLLQNNCEPVWARSPDHQPRCPIGPQRWALSQLTGTEASDWSRVSQSTSSCSRADCRLQNSQEVLKTHIEAAVKRDS